MNKYCNKITELFTKCIFGDRSVKDVLTEIVDITKIYSVTLKDLSGVIMFISLIVSTLFMLLFLLLPLFKRFKGNFSFLSYDLWFFYCIGYILIISTAYINFGDFTKPKCNLRYTLMFTGIFFSNMMILCKLLMCFPDNNKYTQFFNTHKFEFILLTTVIAVIINFIFLFTPYSVQKVMFEITEEHKNFEKCTMTSIFGNIWTLFNILLNGFIILCNFFLCFIEWNVKEIYEDIRVVVINEYLNFFAMILLIILDYTNINDYNIVFIIHIILIIILCNTNYYFIHLIRMLCNKSSDDDKSEMINRRNSTSNSKVMISMSSKSRSSGFFSKILNYHYSNYSTKTHSVVASQSTRRDSYIINSNSQSRRDSHVNTRRESYVSRTSANIVDNVSANKV
ncbi:hypothetical protein BCR32DRAFT_266796 [Anaeromyces robustus]|uniref:G-protein coupled receptors family 3 profile domain-containing protein n=1 Tax=Anaeromyces robustus TaxID=1754192 RepID=A0A1Y1XDA2_9FUNG|nr:hypothetical protein BCR32DRAFT_266796 [Anaeromyces robustus]|eukprot:ORX83697.1 hypothetical protein BCR32DRAFT_266796 [Anaeromyces robustus]